MEDIRLDKLIREEEYRKPTCCSKCGKLLKYVGVGEYECSACGFTEYDDYGLVRAFIEQHPGSNIVKVERATGVSQKTIKGLIRAGKLTISSTNGNLLEGTDE